MPLTRLSKLHLHLHLHLGQTPWNVRRRHGKHSRALFSPRRRFPWLQQSLLKSRLCFQWSLQKHLREHTIPSKVFKRSSVEGLTTNNYTQLTLLECFSLGSVWHLNLGMKSILFNLFIFGLELIISGKQYVKYCVFTTFWCCITALVTPNNLHLQWGLEWNYT